MMRVDGIFGMFFIDFSVRSIRENKQESTMCEKVAYIFSIPIWALC
jgi:hypothetical protein